MTAAGVIYLLCAATSLVAAGMLWRQYLRRRTPLLLWSSVGFVGLAINNVLVWVDLGLFTGVDLSLIRSAAAAIAIVVLVYGLIWEASA